MKVITWINKYEMITYYIGEKRWGWIWWPSLRELWKGEEQWPRDYPTTNTPTVFWCSRWIRHWGRNLVHRPRRYRWRRNCPRGMRRSSSNIDPKHPNKINNINLDLYFISWRCSNARNIGISGSVLYLLTYLTFTSYKNAFKKPTLRLELINTKFSCFTW